MSFSLYFTDGARPIGRIDWAGTKLNHHVVYMSKKRPNEVQQEAKIPAHLRADKTDELEQLEEAIRLRSQQRPMEILGYDYFKRSDHDNYMRKGDMAIMAEALETDADDLSDYAELAERPEVKSYMQQKLLDAKHELKTRKEEFKIGGTMKPMINPDARECIFIVGPSGAGKSTYAANIMKDYARVYPDNNIFVVSKVVDDPAFTSLGDRIVSQPLDQDLVEAINSGMSSTLKDCMVVFDDIDTIANVNLKAALFKLRADLLQTGRHGTVYVVNTSHVFRGGKQTKEANMESTSVVVFPGTGDHYHMRDYLKVYGGLTMAQIDRIMRMPSNWVAVHRGRNAFVVHEHGGYFLQYEPLIKHTQSNKKRKTSMFEE